MIAISKGACTGCGTCVKVCPHGVITVSNKVAVLACEDRCIECGACMINCKFDAMTVTKGTGCLFAIVAEDILKIKPKTAEAV